MILISAIEYEETTVGTESGKQIENYRLKCGLTQQEAANSIGASRSAYSQFDLKTVLLNSLNGYLEVNLSKNEIIGDVIDKTESNRQVAVNLNTADGRRFTYDEFAQWWAKNMLLSNPKPFIEMSNCNWLISCFRTGKQVVDITCTSRDSEGTPRELKHTYYISQSDNGDIYAICVVSVIADSGKALFYSKQYAEIAAELSDSFEGIFYIDTDDDSYISLKTRGAFFTISHNLSGKNFFASSLHHLRNMVSQDDYIAVADFLNKKTFFKKLNSGNSASIVFRLQLNNQNIYYRARISKSGYDDHHVIFALENITEYALSEKLLNEKLQRDKTIIEILASEYSSIYYVDLETNTFEIYKLNSAHIPDAVKDVQPNISFMEAYAQCVDEMVYESDRAEMLAAGSIYNILSELRDHESFSTVYRANLSDEIKYCEMKIARVGNSPLPRYVVIGFADNSAEKTREIEKEKNIALMLQLSNNFEAVYDINISKGNFICYSNSSIFSKNLFANVPLDDDFFCSIEVIANQAVYVEDRPLVKTFLTRKYLKGTLSKNTDFQIDLRLIIDGIPTWYHIKAVLNKDNYGQGIILGLFNIESQRKKEFNHISELKKLTREAHYDMLTGIQNRNAYMLFYNEMDKTMLESKQEFAIAVFDINNLKTINDQFGHDEGDRFIKQAASLICETFQHSTVFRIGGDEFVAVLNGRDFNNREKLIESIRHTSKINQKLGRAVIACGISDRIEKDTCFADVFARADKEMYNDKNRLKNAF